MKLYTIGFTQKSADEFFTLLQQAKVKRVLDVRLHNESQLAGFSKKKDLEYFLRAIADIAYVHLSELAPTPELFDQYKKKGGAWPVFEKNFVRLLASRKVDERVPKALLDKACLLCSEPSAEHCHRRLVAEYLQAKWGDVEIVHL